MPCVHILELQVGEVQSQIVYLALEHKPQRHGTVGKIERVRDGHGMISPWADEDAQRAVLEVHLFVALGALGADGATAVSGVIGFLLLFGSGNIVMENQFSLICQ